MSQFIYRVTHPHIPTLEFITDVAKDEDDAVFQCCVEHPIETKLVSSEHFIVERKLQEFKLSYVPVHFGFLTANLYPEVAKNLGLSAGSRLSNEDDFFKVVGAQNAHIIMSTIKAAGEDVPEDFGEAVKLFDAIRSPQIVEDVQ